MYLLISARVGKGNIQESTKAKLIKSTRQRDS
jgi:hypothetical protein